MGFEDRIVIAHRLRGAVRFVFPLRLRGLRARMGRRGVVRFVDRRGRVVASTSTGRVESLQLDGLKHLPLRTGRAWTRLVRLAGGGEALVVVPDPRFLRDRRVGYPVAVDSGPIGTFTTGSARSRRRGRTLRSCGGPGRAARRGAGAACSSRARALGPSARAANICTDFPLYCGDAPGPATSVLAAAYNEQVTVTWGPPVDGDPHAQVQG
jgi:hypothetical protein